MDIKVGDTLLCIFNQLLPGNEYGPKLIHGNEYICKAIYTDKFGGQHVDVGLPMEINWVKSYLTEETLPSGIHWCHPNRFIVVPSRTITLTEEEAKLY